MLKVPLKSQSFNQPTPRIQKIIIAVSGLFGEGAIREFVEEVVGLFAASKLPVPVIYNDNTAKLYYLLRISMKGTFFSKLVQSHIALSTQLQTGTGCIMLHNFERFETI